MIAREALRWNGWGRLGESAHMTRSREIALLAELGRRLGRPLARSALTRLAVASRFVRNGSIA